MQLMHLQLQLSLVILSFRELQFQLLLPACTGLQKMGYGATHICIQLHWQKCAEFCTLWQCVSLHISTSNCILWLAGWLAGSFFFFFFAKDFLKILETTAEPANGTKQSLPFEVVTSPLFLDFDAQGV